MSAKKVALADRIPQLQELVLRAEIEVVRLIELEAVPDAHHPPHIVQRFLLRDAVAGNQGELNVDDRAHATDAERAKAVHALIRRVGDHDEVVRVEVESACRRTLVEDADDLVALGADADELADRIDAARLEQQLERRVAEHADVLAELDVVAVEEPAGQKLQAGAFGKPLARAEDDERLGFLFQVEDAILRRGAHAGAELDVDELNRRRLLLERARVGDREVRPLEQILDLGAVGEARDAEALHR